MIDESASESDWMNGWQWRQQQWQWQWVRVIEVQQNGQMNWSVNEFMFSVLFYSDYKNKTHDEYVPFYTWQNDEWMFICTGDIYWILGRFTK